ncbi:efflux RND transporter periplasmic adaptor subunit [Litorivicinus lipolyticus]|uniref:Efflux RND transporter periplasmic adaptor subunit n=1 Tax=Litorivicinus lipolyticus TaxID=418701 RepID=A0A5Q2QBD1_9GAMM|nr:efflux RND transporter periplasmic adaptor subunit [Litorivicinus lipolyticus]QGG79582.1 efflux RND transporter periplasmic adaptor subunit [Litorivicinus lipolyticus]
MRFFTAIRDNFLWYCLSALILAVGVGGFQVMGALKTPVQAEPQPRQTPIVSTVIATPMSAPLPVRADGFVRPFRQVAVAAQTGGRVVSLHPAIEQRARVERGETLAQLDDRVARANLARAEADLAGNQANLALLTKQLARTESLYQQGSVSLNQLDQLETQVTQVRSAILSLKAARQSAQVAVDNTRIEAPFAGRVLDQSAELGAVLGAGQAVATLFTDTAMEVELSLTKAEAALIPDLMGAGQAAAIVEWSDHRYAARVQRVSPAINAKTRTLGVTVRVLDAISPNAPALLANSYVKVTIDGHAVSDSVMIPSTALRVGNQVWVDQNGSLRVRSVEVIHRDQEILYVRAPGLAGQAVIVSSLDGARDGMPVRAERSNEPQSGAN